MKKFTFFLIDDEPNNHLQFIRMLELHRYLTPCDGAPKLHTSSLELLGWNKDESRCMNFKVVTSNYNEDIGYTYCMAIESFEKDKELFDFYVFDLNFGGSTTLNPTHESNECDQAKAYSSNGSPKAMLFAGNDFLDLTPDDRFKIVYSVTPENLGFLAAIKGRPNTVVIKVATSGLGHFSIRTAENHAFEKLDQHLRIRQVAILNRQPLSVRERIMSRLVDTADLIEIRDADEGDILDQAGDDQAIEFWSLQTLFPKQVNIVAEREEAAHKRKAVAYIREVVQPDFRWLIWWSLAAHANPQGESRGDRIDCFRWRVNTLKQLDSPDIVQGKKAQVYRDKKISNFSSCTDTLLDGRALSIFPDVTAKLAIGKLRSDVVQSWTKLGMFQDAGIEPGEFLVKDWANWGVYALDIWYIYHIAHSNKRHLGARSCSLEVAALDDRLEFVFKYDSSTEHLTQKELTDRMAGAQLSANQAFSYPDLRISTDGIEDIVNLICKRYAADFEFTLGPLKLSATPAREVLVTSVPEPNTTSCYRFVVHGKIA
jgi:hypothetical protein